MSPRMGSATSRECRKRRHPGRNPPIARRRVENVLPRVVSNPWPKMSSRLRLRGHGMESDAPIDEMQWHVVEWRHELVARLRTLRREAEALEAAGLSTRRSSASDEERYLAWKPDSSRDNARTMPEKNVEIVRRAFDSLNRGEIDEALVALADDFEMDWTNSIGPIRGAYRGRDEVRAVWAAYVEAFESVSWKPEEIIRVDDSRLVVTTRVSVRGLGSGVPVEAGGAQVWRFSEGRAVGAKLYQSKAEALEAAGLTE